MANVDLRNLRYDSAVGYGKPVSELRYDSGGITRGCHKRTAIALYNHEQANGCNVVNCIYHPHSDGGTVFSSVRLCVCLSVCLSVNS